MLKEGRWGPYVTDGETNASLRKGDDVESITLQRAAELLAERRAAGAVRPAPPGRRHRQPAAKTAAKNRHEPQAGGQGEGRYRPAGAARPARPARANHERLPSGCVACPAPFTLSADTLTP